MRGDRFYYATKTNGNFPGNPASNGLPTIQGVLSLHDADNGRLLALMDSMELTMIRTAAASAVAAKYLARADSRSVTILGCGIQGRSQLRALSHVRSIEEVFAYDFNEDIAREYSMGMAAELDCTVTAVKDYHDAVRASDVIITCTPSREPLLRSGDIRPGAFIAAVGADSEHKSEISPDLLAASKVVVDVLEQCATIGDLHHAIEAGVMRRENVHADLADVVNDTKPGRRSDEEIIIFDSTGTALEDVAAAAVVYELAIERDAGIRVDLGA
jgi:ornithine cyclodeaminase/alanine dehydrogenase-like protein (mu-crystallin family)